jgi:hypothetical protein
MISLVVPLSGVYRWKSPYKSLVSSSEVVGGFIVVIKRRRAILKVYLLLSYFIRKGLSLRGERSLLLE